MAALSDTLRKLLEKAVLSARAASESAAEAAINALAVAQPAPYPSLTPDQRTLRNALRARSRQLGDDDMTAGIRPLIEEVAYEGWHRMLFARFLAENNLLMHPSGVAVTLEECAELAPDEGEPDAWSLAARYASAMLPGIFRVDDPSSQVRFAPEGRAALEGIIAGLPQPVFTADDALGWVYQFWQATENAEILASGRKIGAAELPAVTQFFTEDYMVRFLLENSLGAWWAGKHPDSPLLKEWEYLRFKDDGTTAVGTFSGWPRRAAEVTVMDPCCGSGHFLVAAFEMLRRMRMEGEGLTGGEAGDAVLRDNLFGLEIDPRCSQIAAFALALVAWRTGGYRQLPRLNVACSGIPVTGQLDDWTRLAGNDGLLKMALERLHNTFRAAPTLGSLINPADTVDPLFTPEYSQLQQLLNVALEKQRVSPSADSRIFGAAAEGVTQAAALLVGSYTLIATNVPYLKRSKQDSVLAAYCASRFPEAKADLATAFVERCRAFAAQGGTVAIVTPQNWLFLGTYGRLRRRLLHECSWNLLARLGPAAFRDMNWWAANTLLLMLTAEQPVRIHEIISVNVSDSRDPSEKERLVQVVTLESSSQNDQLGNPDARITSGEAYAGTLLSRYADSYAGIQSGDYPRFGRCFWELPVRAPTWEFQQSTAETGTDFGGREHVLFWEEGRGNLAACPGAYIRGLSAFGKRGVAVKQMQDLPCTLYTGELFDNNTAVIIPRNAEDLPAIWAFSSSPGFSTAVRKIDQALKVTNATLVKIPFDLEHWQKVAADRGPLPEPFSGDPTQWLFKGDPANTTRPLQVALARLLGYRWPDQEPNQLDAHADEDGIVCLPPITGEQPAAERLRALLATVYGDSWSSARQDELLAQVGYAGKDLHDWLRDGFFAQHCKLFHNRPFIWHIWDGQPRDGFSALVNYHKLDAAGLNRLIYTYLGSWIETQRAQHAAGEAGAEARLVAALQLQGKLQLIAEGEPPHDIYVRWKPLPEQPIGWSPDLNDGVRLNIRPFVTAGVLRGKFTVNWNKDRGTNPDGSERLNDLHFTNAQKRAARGETGT